MQRLRPITLVRICEITRIRDLRALRALPTHFIYESTPYLGALCVLMMDFIFVS